MADLKTWARLAGDRVAELLPLPADLVPGDDVPDIWTHDVTAVAGIAVGWRIGADGTFSAPPVDLAALRTAKLADLSAACGAAIDGGGFASSALGAVHGYSLEPNSRENLQAAVTATLLPGLAPDWTTPIWCADASGAWSFAPHTTTQIQQVGRDAMAAVLATRLRLQTLSTAVRAATTEAAISAIAWA